MIQTLKNTGSKCSAGWRKHTMKRETAVALLIFWGLITIKIFWQSDVGVINALTGVYAIATPAIFTFVTAVFGFDAYAKQIKNNGG